MIKYYNSRRDMIEAMVPEGTRGAKIGTTCPDFNAILLNRNPQKLYLVDDWWEEELFYGETFDVKTRFRYDEVVAPLKEMPNVELRRQNGMDFLDTFSDDTLDWIYLDMPLTIYGGLAARDGRGIETDDLLRKCCSKLKPDGLVMGSHGDADASRRCLAMYFSRKNNHHAALTHEESNHNMSWAFYKKPKHKLKIKVVQFFIGNTDYYPLSERINRHYCARHGYEYACEREIQPHVRDYERHVIWEKIPVIQKHLTDCDFVFFLDADAIFYGQEFQIEALAYDMCPFAVMRVAAQISDEYWRHWNNEVNAGTLLVRNNERAHHFLDIWNHSTDADEQWRFKIPMDQGALNFDFMPTYPYYIFREENYYLMNGLHGMFVRHWFGCDDRERYGHMAAFIEKHGME